MFGERARGFDVRDFVEQRERLQRRVRARAFHRAGFDASGRETCTMKRSRTNTPLQALTLLNEVTYVEASRALAEHMIKDAGSTPADRITLGFRRAIGRP